MNGGPATIDLWDVKRGHANGGPFQEIATATPGLRIGEHLPAIARWSERLAIVRSMTTKEGDHGRAAYTFGRAIFPKGPSISDSRRPGGKGTGAGWQRLPPFVSIAPSDSLR